MKPLIILTIAIASTLTLFALPASASPSGKAARFESRLERAEANGRWAQGSRGDRTEDRFDRFEDRLDRRENRRDEAVDLGRRDVIEDRYDRFEDRRDRRENRVDWKN